MRSVLVLSVALCLAPGLAWAGAHLHLPHARHHHRGEGSAPAAGPAAPVSGIPDPVWASSSPTRR